VNEIVERVARAIYCIGEPKWDIWAVMDETQRDLWRSRARAAIEALREPSEAMAYAIKHTAIGADSLGWWRAGIDAALTLDMDSEQ
jgi:hypothetical protein